MRKLTKMTDQPNIQPIPEIVPAKKFNPLLISALLTAILLIGLGGVYAGIMIGRKQSVVPTSTVEPTVAPVVDETTNWKTYRNEKLGFEFKYPYPDENLVAEDKPVSDLGAVFSQGFGKQEHGGYSFYLAVYLNKNKIDLKTFYIKMSESSEFYEGLMFDEKYATNTKLLSNGAKAYFFKDGYCVSLCDRYVWSNNELVYELINYKKGTLQNSQLFDQILSTFKFLDQTTNNDQVEIESLVNTFETFNQQKKVNEVMSLMTLPKTDQEKEIYNSMMGLDSPGISPRLFSNTSSNYKLNSWKIIEIQKNGSTTETKYTVKVEETRDNGTTNAGVFLGIQKDFFVFEIVKVNNQWLVDKYIWPKAGPETINNPLKYRGFGF